MMPVRAALKLGRVSNLPTVWTNVFAGIVLSGTEPTAGVVVTVGLAASLLYLAGMFLNDAFDRRWDAQHRPERPIPAGEVTARAVFTAGFSMMGAALVILLVAPVGARAFFAGLVLAGLIVLYDVSHKKNRFAPLVMGLCRVGVYVLAAFAMTPSPAPTLYVGALFLLVYLILLTVIARSETTNAKLPVLVARLIAGISLIDGGQILIFGYPVLAGLCAGAFVLTLRLQRRIAGT